MGLTDRGTRERIPLRERPWDMVIVAFFCTNLFFITYIVDIEQLTVPNAYHFHYPLWPPPPLVNLVHWWGNHFDPLLMARPPFWKMTIWIDAVFFGPFYAVAIYAFIRGRDWIRLPSVYWAGMMVSNVLIILAEEYSGVHRSPHFGIVLAANVPWLLLPAGVVLRMMLSAHPFTRPARVSTEPGTAGALAPARLAAAGD